MATVSQIRITPLKGKDDYKVWWIRMRQHLENTGLLNYALGAFLKPARCEEKATADEKTARLAEIAAWVAIDGRAKSDIQSSVSDDIVVLLDRYETSADMIRGLEDQFSDLSPLMAQTGLERFYTYKMSNSESAVNGFNTIEMMARALKSLGHKLEDDAISMRIVKALSDRFYTVKQYWSCVPPAQRKLDDLLNRIRTAEHLQLECGAWKPGEAESSAFYSGKKPWTKSTRGRGQGRGSGRGNQNKVRKCYNCELTEHLARDCPEPKKQRDSDGGNPRQGKNKGGRDKQRGRENGNYANYIEAEKNEQGNKDIHSFAYPAVMADELEELEFSLLARSEATRSKWILDSGASQHVTGNMSLFSSYKELNPPIKVMTTGDQIVYATARGTVEMQSLEEDKWYDCTLENVLYIKDSVNLFAACSLTRKGMTCTLGESYAYFEQEGIKHQGPYADRMNTMYVMRFRQPVHTAFATIAEKTNKIHQ